MDLMKTAKLQIVKDEPRVTRDGFAYRATEWRHVSGEPVYVNVDDYGYHARIRGETRANLSPVGLVQFVQQMFG